MKKKIQSHLIILLLLSGITKSIAQNGTPDLTFSSDAQLGYLDFPNDIITADILETNGHIFALLSSVNGGTDSFILKLNDDGSYDTSFGTAGVLTLQNTSLYDGALSADHEHIYLVATVNQVYSIASYNLDGSIDQAWTALPILTGFSKILVDQDGNIVIGSGTVINDLGYGIVMKLNNQLQSITSFGINGIATTPDHGFSFPLMEIDHDNRILLATYNNGANMWRFNADGSFDQTFDYSLDVSSFSLPNWILDFAIAPDNGIYVQPNTYGNQSYLFKINSAGNVDLNFGEQGHIILTEDDPDLGAFPDELLSEPSGGLIIMGSAFNANSTMSGKFLARLDENGILDNTFQGGPHVIDDNNYDLRINFHCATLQEDGKVLSMDQIALWQNNELQGYNVLLTRFNNDNASGVTSLETLTNFVSLYPNPTNGAINFRFTQENVGAKFIEVYDEAGKLILQEKLQQNNINLENLRSGLYNVVVRCGAEVETTRVLKL